MTIPIWANGKGLVIDVAVTSPLTAAHVRLSSPCDDYAFTCKHKKYDASFEGLPYIFAAVVFETTGAISEEGQEVLRQLFRFAAKNLGHEFSSYCGRAWARFSCTLQVTQSILTRIDGAASLPRDYHSLDMSPAPAPSPAASTVAPVRVLSEVKAPARNPLVAPLVPAFPAQLVSHDNPSSVSSLCVSESESMRESKSADAYVQQGTPMRKPKLSPPLLNPRATVFSPDRGCSSFGHTGLSPFKLAAYFPELGIT